MSDEVLKTIAIVSGLAGISIALVFSIFRSIIQKKIFPTLTKEQAYKIINTIILSTVLVALVGIVAWVYTSNPPQVTPTSIGGSEPTITPPILEKNLSLNGIVSNKETRQPIEGIIVELSAHDIVSAPTDAKGSFQINGAIKTNRTEIDLHINDNQYHFFNGTFDLNRKTIVIALKRKG